MVDSHYPERNLRKTNIRPGKREPKTHTTLFENGRVDLGGGYPLLGKKKDNKIANFMSTHKFAI